MTQTKSIPQDKVQCDEDEILRTLNVLIPTLEAVELRALGVTKSKYVQNKVFAGYFDDPEKMAACAAELDPFAKGIYVTLNPVNPRLLARSYNEVKKGLTPTTQDGDIIRRRFLLVDADARRPSGISATDEEHDAALALIHEIRDVLTQKGWPQPIVADSGNGGHLLYRIDLPAQDGGLVEQCLEALAFLFNDQAVSVDRSVHNPSRITKLYGTVARKGSHVPHLGMPHRVSRILHAPEALEVVPASLLHALTDCLPSF